MQSTDYSIRYSQDNSRFALVYNHKTVEICEHKDDNLNQLVLDWIGHDKKWTLDKSIGMADYGVYILSKEEDW